MTDRPADLPPFKVDPATFSPWIVTDPDGSERYEWRSAGGRCIIGRNTGNAMWWAKADGHLIGTHYASPKLAMIAAVQAAQRRNAA